MESTQTPTGEKENLTNLSLAQLKIRLQEKLKNVKSGLE